MFRTTSNGSLTGGITRGPSYFPNGDWAYRYKGSDELSHLKKPADLEPTEAVD
ncbi:hypothetical protein [Rhodococcus globerulus]|uniref:hypothetical protein n=1 Tax=Rhodococcus globerulus TaxID=33008 RepID=UPI003015BA0D